MFFFIIECIRGNGFVLDLQRRDGSFSGDVIVDPIILGRFEIYALGQTGFIMKLICFPFRIFKMFITKMNPFKVMHISVW